MQAPNLYHEMKKKNVSLKESSRRDFLKKSALALGAFAIVPRHVLGKGFIAPSDTLTKGIIGVGGMGRGHIPYEGTKVIAMCDVDKVHLKDAIALAGGFTEAAVASTGTAYVLPSLRVAI